MPLFADRTRPQQTPPVILDTNLHDECGCESIDEDESLPKHTSQQLISANMARVGRHCEDAILSSRIRQIRIIHRQIIRMRIKYDFSMSFPRRPCKTPPEDSALDKGSHMTAQPPPDSGAAATTNTDTTSPHEENSHDQDRKQPIYHQESLSASTTSVAALNQSAPSESTATDLHDRTSNTSVTSFSQNVSRRNIHALNQTEDPMPYHDLHATSNRGSLNASFSQIAIYRVTPTTYPHIIALVLIVLLVLVLYFTPVLNKSVTSEGGSAGSGGWEDSTCQDSDLGPTL